MGISEPMGGSYVTVGLGSVLSVTFTGGYSSIRKTLNVFAPSDSTWDWYVLNGKVKKFTSKQKIRDQNAYPTMT